jgi:hypothetical protein
MIGEVVDLVNIAGLEIHRSMVPFILPESSL